jgi:hypothetical protein
MKAFIANDSSIGDVLVLLLDIGGTASAVVMSQRGMSYVVPMARFTVDADRAMEMFGDAGDLGAARRDLD